MIKLARKQCPKARFEIGNAYKLDFKKDYFDIITASLVFDHVKNLEKAIKEIKNVLKKQGLLFFSIPHPIVYMFKNSELGKFVPSNSYFDKETVYYHIAKSKFKFPGFPRTLEEYFQAFLKQGFSLLEFRENQPKKRWNKIDKMFTNMPHIAFFAWRKE